MRDDPYTPKSMEAARSEAHAGGDRFDGLHEEATAAVGEGAISLQRIRERYQEAYDEKLARWQTLRDDLERLEGGRGAEPSSTDGVASEGSVIAITPAPIGIDERRTRVLRQEVDRLVWELADHQAELGRIDLTLRTFERTRRFLERGGEPMFAEADAPTTNADVAMRIVESEEAERSRLAQEIHDGPAQSLSNAIFQVEFIERVMATDPRLAGTELRQLRVLLRRELGDMRTFISQLRPPRLDEVGLDAAIDDAVEHARAVTSVVITTSLEGTDRRSQRGRADGRAARGPGSPPECPQARLGDERADHHLGGGRRVRPRGPRRRSRLRQRDGGRPGPPPLRPSIHARASRADRRSPGPSIATGRRHRRPAHDPH